MTRLEILCKAHKQQGGTIFQFNKQYNLDFLMLAEPDFQWFINELNAPIRYCYEDEQWEEQ